MKTVIRPASLSWIAVLFFMSPFGIIGLMMLSQGEFLSGSAFVLAYLGLVLFMSGVRLILNEDRLSFWRMGFKVWSVTPADAFVEWRNPATGAAIPFLAVVRRTDECVVGAIAAATYEPADIAEIEKRYSR